MTLVKQVLIPQHNPDVVCREVDDLIYLCSPEGEAMHTLDLVAADWGGGGKPGATVYLSEDGRLSDTPQWSAQTTRPAHEVILADLDADGDLDMALGCQDQAHVFENTIRDAKRK